MQSVLSISGNKPYLQEQLAQQVSENNFTAKDEYSVGLPILSVSGIGFDSNWNSGSQAFSRLFNIPMNSLYSKI
jgi:hypothetical protein